MPEATPASFSSDRSDDQAAAWVLRAAAGLTLEEEQQLAAWLAADPRHAASFAEHQRAWDRFGPLAARSLASEAAPRRRRWLLPLAAAAAVALGLFVWRGVLPSAAEPPAFAAGALLAPCERRTLPDGSVVELNRGAEIRTNFTDAERLVELVRGEAGFTVARDAARPFVVVAGAVRVCAVGTVFNVRLAPGEIEVVVTEGRVEVAAPAIGTDQASRPVLDAGQALLVPLVAAPEPPVVATLSAEELEAKLAWQPRLLDFDDVALADIVADFNRRNPVQLVVADPGLAALRLTVSFRSDNVEGFVRLLEAHYGVRARPGGEAEVVLGRR